MTKPKGSDKTREEMFKEGEIPVPYPKSWDGDYLVKMFFKVGPISGERPINWQEIDAYSRLTNADLEPWEAETLSEMSRAFLEECNTSKSPHSIEPFERNYG